MHAKNLYLSCITTGIINISCYYDIRELRDVAVEIGGALQPQDL